MSATKQDKKDTTKEQASTSGSGQSQTSAEEQKAKEQVAARRRATEERNSRKEEWEADQERRRVEQGLPEGAVPENRDLRYNNTPDSAVVKALREAGDPRGGQTPAHGFEEYERAHSDAQIKKAAKESEGNGRYFAGQRGWINNPGEPDHGRAVGILAVSEYETDMDEVLDKVQGGRGKAKSYFTESRDGRAEKLTISAEHFLPCYEQAEWGKTPLMTARPDIGMET